MDTTTSTLVTHDALVQWELQLITQLSTYTLAYIGFAIAIILALGGVFYLLTLRPYEKELQRQAGQIKSASDRLEEVRAAITQDVDEDLSAAEDRISESTVVKISDAEERISVSVGDQLEIAQSQMREEVSSREAALLGVITAAKEEFIKEIRNLESKISTLNTSLAERTAELKEVRDANRLRAANDKDVEIRLRAVEVFRYAQENRMGSIIIPTNTIEELIGTRDEWRIPRFMDMLKENLKDAEVETDERVRITGVLEKLPAKYAGPKGEILQLLGSNSSTSHTNPSSTASPSAPS